MNTAILMAAWMFVAARAIWLRTIGTRLLTWLILWWTLAATIAHPALTPVLVGLIGQRAATTAYWVILLSGDLTALSLMLWWATGDRSIRIRRIRRWTAAGYLALVAVCSGRAPGLGLSAHVSDWATAAFIVLASIPVSIASIGIGYLTTTRMTRAVRRSDRLVAVALLVVTAVGVVLTFTLIGQLGVAAIRHRPSEMADASLDFITSGHIPLLYAVEVAGISVLFGATALYQFLTDRPYTSAADRLEPMWRDLGELQPGLLFPADLATAHERLVWIDTDLRDAVRILTPRIEPLAPDIREALRSLGDHQAAIRAAELLLAARRSAVDNPANPPSEHIPIERIATVWPQVRRLVGQDATVADRAAPPAS